MNRRLMALLATLGVCAAGTDAAQATSVTNRNGTYTLDLAITLTTPVPEGASVICTFSIQVIDGTAIITESAGAPASVSGDSATCDMNIPYRWYLGSDPATDAVSFSYQVQMVGSGGTQTTIGVPPINTHTTFSEDTRL